MTRRPLTTTLLTTGAVAVAAIAYGVGTQTGDGTAIAAKSASGTTGSTGATGPAGFRGRDHGGPGGRGRGPLAGAAFAALAKDLGVTPAALRTALRELRPTLKGERRGDALTAALAESTGASTADVRAALEAQRPARGDRRGGGPRGGGPGHGGPGHGGPGRGEGGPGPRGRGPAGLDTAALAAALSATEAEVTEGLEAARAAHRAEHAQRRAAFVKALADKLDVDEAKVAAAIPERRKP